MGLYELSGEMSGEELEISGADEYLLGLDKYLMGATPRKPTSGAGAPTIAVKRKQPTAVRELFLGFDSVTVVTKSTSRNVTTQAQQPFRPDRLVVAAAIAGFFLINDIKIGSKSQLLSGDAIPAEAFSNLSVGVVAKMDTITPGITVMLSVSNIDTLADHRFNGMMLGPALQ